jgi:hypothetical protein
MAQEANMSRTTRRIPGHIRECPNTDCTLTRERKWDECRNYAEWCWDDHTYLKRGHRQPEKHYWPRYDGWWAWPDDSPNRPEGRRWLKRHTSKYRRRRGQLEIKRQLE